MYLLPFSLISSRQTDEIQITTISEEARQLYIDARDLSEQMEFGKAIVLLNKALKIDSGFALAYLLKARQITNINDQKFYLRKAEEMCYKISEGEKILVHYYSSIFSAEDKLRDNYLKKLTDNYPDDKRVQFIAASEKYLAGEYYKALELLTKVIELDPFYFPAYTLLGYCKAELDEEESNGILLDLFTLIPVKELKVVFL